MPADKNSVMPKRIKVLVVKPCELKEANKYIAEHHRHHKPVQGHRFSLKLVDLDDNIVGVICAGRPVARKVNHSEVLEVTRCCTDGTRNAITMLYGAVCRAAKAMGFKQVQTYTLPEEGGASMKAAGFHMVGLTPGGQWKHTDGKQRRTDQPTTPKHKWIRTINGQDY